MGRKFSGETGNLSAMRVAALIRKRVTGMHSDGLGLYLQIKGDGGASWIYRYRRDGIRTARDMGLGPCHTITLAEAREKARAFRRMRIEGLDPIEERRAEREKKRLAKVVDAARTMSFRGCAENYLAANESSWKNARHRQQWRNTLADYVYPTIGDLPVQQVDEAGIVKVLTPIWHEKAETARRVRSRIELVLEWAIASKFFIGDNPARHARLKHLLGTQGDTVVHLPALPYGEIGSLVVKLHSSEDIGALPTEFCILTATRTGEVIGADWSEVDRPAKTWTIPGHRRKGRKGKEQPLTVPLPSRALEILDEAARRTGREVGLIFPDPTGKRLSETSLLSTLKQLGCTTTTHGMRSAFRDWAGDTTTFPRDLIEEALGHKIGNQVERAYRRGSALERRRRLMEMWARYCATPSTATGEVVAIGARKGA